MKKDQGKLTVGSSVVGSSDGFIVVGSTVGSSVGFTDGCGYDISAKIQRHKLMEPKGIHRNTPF